MIREGKLRLIKVELKDLCNDMQVYIPTLHRGDGICYIRDYSNPNKIIVASEVTKEDRKGKELTTTIDKMKMIVVEYLSDQDHKTVLSVPVKRSQWRMCIHHRQFYYTHAGWVEKGFVRFKLMNNFNCAQLYKRARPKQDRTKRQLKNELSNIIMQYSDIQPVATVLQNVRARHRD